MRRSTLVLGLAAMLCPASLQADPSSIDPSIGKVEVTLDLPKDKPYIGEMIMLRVRSFIRADVVLDEFRQPPLTNFNWQQLGRDKPVQAMVDGFRVDGIERDIAIYPQQSGRLIIEPFLRHVTIQTSNNERVQADFASKPIYFDVQNYSAILPEGTWWLPSKSVTVTDNWSVQPDEIKPGELARRTIVVEAVGVTGDRLPPPPEMRAPGTIAFRGPVQRETVVTEDGPIGRGTYQWDLRPVSSSPAKLPAVHVAWFDTSERRMRDAAIPETWVAYVGTLVHPSHEKAKTWRERYISAGPVVAGLAAFLWTGAFAVFLATSRRPVGYRALRRAKALSALRRASRYGSADGFAQALVDLGRSDPARWTRVSRDPAIASGIAAFGAARYGTTAGEPPPLKPLGAEIRRLWLESDAGEGRSGALPPIDGAMGLRPSFTQWLRLRFN